MVVHWHIRTGTEMNIKQFIYKRSMRVYTTVRVDDASVFAYDINITTNLIEHIKR